MMTRRWVLLVCFVFSLASTARAGGDVAYVAELDDEQENHILWAEIGDERYELAREPLLSIVREADFDRDGVLDVLVSISQGGNCCPEEYALFSFVHGAVRTARFEAAWASYEVVERAGGLAIVQKTNEETTVSVLTDGRLAVVETIPKLVAVKEIYGLGPAYEGEQQYQVFEVDLDDDGVPEAIRCEHWARWGSMLCALPLPGREPQGLSLGCDRVGLLEAKSNGFHHLVCNNDALFVFDGHGWVVSDVPTERLAERIRALEGVIGGYPPHIADAIEQAAVTRSYEEIRAALDAILARPSDERHLRQPHLLFLRGALQAMGHNFFDYPGAWQGASDDLRAVLAKDADHVPSLLTLGRLLVNSTPEFAPEAEKLFRAAQCVHGERPLAEAQSGLFFALYYQGKMAEALGRAHLLVSTWPQDQQYQRLYDTARAVVERTMSPEVLRDTLAVPVQPEDCAK